MGLFNFLKNKSKSTSDNKFILSKITSIDHPTDGSVKITFDTENIPNEYLLFNSGQYINLKITINNKEEIRSYSLCSKPNNPLEIAVKAISNGIVSNYLKSKVEVGDEILISKPEGNFKINDTDQKIIAFAAGSGITPIYSIAQTIENTKREMLLFYGNKTISSSIFYKEIALLNNSKTRFLFSQEKNESNDSKRVDGTFVKSIVKQDLDILKSDKFLICGPENMIIEIRDALKLFGIKEDKIIYELFTSPVKMESSKKSSSNKKFKGESIVKITLDGKNYEMTVPENGPLLIDAAEKNGIDVPFSCRGGLCCSCRAKVVEGDVKMDVNYALTDQEVDDGYILACQAKTNSSELTISFDE